jgi:rare lipoprotein A (peptidoglycan hydrolase)
MAALLAVALVLTGLGDRPPRELRGIATWYDANRNGTSAWYTRAGIKMYGAAGPALRKLINVKWRMEPYPVLLRSQRTGKQVIVYIVDWCQCLAGGGRERLIDLAPAVWRAIGVDLSRGVTEVTITIHE